MRALLTVRIAGVTVRKAHVTVSHARMRQGLQRHSNNEEE